MSQISNTMQSLINSYSKIQDYTIIYSRQETKVRTGVKKPKNAWLRWNQKLEKAY